MTLGSVAIEDLSVCGVVSDRPYLTAAPVKYNLTNYQFSSQMSGKDRFFHWFVLEFSYFMFNCL